MLECPWSIWAFFSKTKKWFMMRTSTATKKRKWMMDARVWLMPSVVHSVMLYGVPTLAPSLCCNWRAINIILTMVQRRTAIRRVSAYRTVSYIVVAVVLRTAPINLKVFKRFEAFKAIWLQNPTEGGFKHSNTTWPTGLHNPRIQTMIRWAERLRQVVPCKSGIIII